MAAQCATTDADDAAFEAALTDWREANPIAAGTVADVVDHIVHIIEVAGVDHVGLGSDYDGVSLLPEGLEDVSTYPAITRALLSRGADLKPTQLPVPAMLLDSTSGDYGA